MAISTIPTAAPKGVTALVLSDAARIKLEPLLPKGDSLERVASIAALECRKNPDLLKCEPLSIIESIGRILKWGLVIGETAYLVPFGGKCQAIKGVDGIIQLLYDSGHVRAVDARCVFEGEHFVIQQGLEPKLEHTPSIAAKARGNLLGAYCIIRLRGAYNFVFEWFPADQIDAIRQQYSKQWKKGPLPPWYCRKTAVIHTAKMLPKDSKFAAIHDEIRRAESEDVVDAEFTDVTNEPELERPATVDENGEDLEWDGELPLGDAPKSRDALREG